MNVFRALVLTLLIFFCAACPRPPVEAPQRKVNRSGVIDTLQARFRARVQAGGDRRSLRGVLLFRRPEALRLRLMMPFGFTVYDGLSIGGQTWESSPYVEIPKSDPLLPRIAGLSLFRPLRECEELSSIDASSLRISCRGRSGRRILDIDRKSELPRRETVVDSPASVVRADYSDYRQVDNHKLPFEIDISTSQGLKIALSISSYEINSDLPRKAFAQP